MLFAVNGGSGSVAAFRVNRNGSLTTIPGSPVSSLGTDPTSVAVSGSTLLVADTAQDPNRPELTPPDYASLSLRRSDELLYGNPRSVIATDIGSTPSEVLFSPDGKVAFGNNFVGGTLLSFAVSENGRLTQSGEQAPPEGLFEPSGTAPDPLGLAVHPSARILYIGFPFISQVGVYRHNDRGRLTVVGSVANSARPIAGWSPTTLATASTPPTPATGACRSSTSALPNARCRSRMWCSRGRAASSRSTSTARARTSTP